MKVMRSLKKVVISIYFLAGLVLAQVNYAAQASSANAIGVVNIQQVLQQSTHVMELRKKLEDQFKDRQAKINDAQKSFQAEVNKQKKEEATMAPKEMAALNEKIKKDRTALMQLILAYQQDSDREQGKVLQTVMHDLNNVVSNIAKEKGYTLVLDAQAVIYTADKLSDITKKVAEDFDGSKDAK